MSTTLRVHLCYQFSEKPYERTNTNQNNDYVSDERKGVIALLLKIDGKKKFETKIIINQLVRGMRVCIGMGF